MKPESKTLMEFVEALRELNRLYTQRTYAGVPIKSFLLKVEFEGEGQGYMWKSTDERAAAHDLNTAVGLLLSHPLEAYTKALAPFYTLVTQLFDAELARTGNMKQYVIAVEGEDQFNPKLGIAASHNFIEGLIDILPVALELLPDREETKLPANVVPFTPPPTKH